MNDTAAKADRQRVIGGELDNLLKELVVHEEAISGLEIILNPVMRPEVPGPEQGDEGCPITPASEVTTIIKSAIEKIRVLTTIIQTMKDKIEV